MPRKRRCYQHLSLSLYCYILKIVQNSLFVKLKIMNMCTYFVLEALTPLLLLGFKI